MASIVIKKYGIYFADLNPAVGTEPGKVRPVVVVQTDLLNEGHPSTVVCPLTTKVVSGVEILRVHLRVGGRSGLPEPSDILVDQIRAIDNRRFMKKIGELSFEQRKKLSENLHILICE